MRENKRKHLVSWTVLLLALLFIGIGLMNQEYLEVLQKAVRICLECIGIG